MVKSLQTILLLLVLSSGTFSYSLPLSTSKKWIIDSASGRRVKLTCVNWAAHLEPMLAEGLDKKPLKDIVNMVAEQNFNCVRLTWATFMFTRARYDPNSNLSTSYILYHPESGKCVAANVKNEVCTGNTRRWWSRRWSHDGDGGPIRLMGSALCLKVEGDGLPPILSKYQVTV
ncbi:hypothetical protein Dsin_007789 [Dipteronia sinensis]|uniref:Uncharacterized protein n=1 Tax=Dipteronia sinensis TaxID=43782 RepID=A0AAE0B187_9ROSI|nr:hypothetical protein Dsin_007789 [Dipteronia sinensis]